MVNIEVQNAVAVFLQRFCTYPISSVQDNPLATRQYTHKLHQDDG